MRVEFGIFDHVIVGSPATVRAEIERPLAESGASDLVGRFAYGTLAHDDAARSLDLFAREVMPAFAAPATAGAARG
jgi:alkanesulfonate monooxygenase SsuD/methylene tetrahydromethanopterin reductase-like flavin-dependent oxidoreductase (luciferase family)